MRQIDSVRKFAGDFDGILEAARAEFVELGDSDRGGPLELAVRAPDPDGALEVLRGGGGPETLGPGGDPATLFALEAIILDKLRPPYLVLRDKIQIKGDYDRVDLVEAHKNDLEEKIRSVGRVDLFNHSTMKYCGTGWLVAKDIAVTNRHVARVFAEKSWWGGYNFKRGAFNEEMEARLDYMRQHKNGGIRRRADVDDILYIAGSREPDIAFLKVETRDDIEPLELVTGRVADETPVAAVGYPASDGGRNDPKLMKKLYNNIYNVKRFAPGMVTGRRSDGVILLGDYTSLGGNSGSPVLDLESGRVVGLHYAGAFRDTNYAVASDIVAAALARIKTSVTVPEAPVEAPSQPESFTGRDGYDPDFLGTGGLSVPLPGLGRWCEDVAPVSDDADDVLKYRHFSVLQSASRRLPLLTAVNIDGGRMVRLKRKGSWKLDGRLDPEHQIGNELYRHNPLDRGHMVRRRDPGWGDSREQAQEAEIDTFHYTNSTPQHKDLNQRDWVGLEDYVLEAAETRGFRISVFTGPIFREGDRRLREQPGAEMIQIPEEFWKIAVMVNDDTGELSATGYVLSHGEMIRDLTEAAFVLGHYETYQVRIARIEEETGLDFGRLKEFDPLGDVADTESFGEAVQRIAGPGDLRL